MFVFQAYDFERAAPDRLASELVAHLLDDLLRQDVLAGLEEERGVRLGEAIFTVPGSTASTCLIMLMNDRLSDALAGSRMRSNENLTSSEVSGLPSVKLTPLRSLKV